MRTPFTANKWFCVLGLALVPASLLAAQDKPSSILSRVQTVDDPELGELIRVALLRPMNPPDKAATVRAITESYAQIKLLDQQIEQIARRIDTRTVPSELRHELLLAKAELESKRLRELANLREVMGIIPQYAFGEQPVSSLRTWLELDAVDSHVRILERLQPYGFGSNYRSVGLMSKTEALDYIHKLLATPDALPIRIEIHRTAEGIELSEDLRDAVIELAKRAGQAMQAEVRLDEQVRPGFQLILRLESGVPDIFVTSIDPTLPSSRRVSSVEPNALESHLLRELSRPGRLSMQVSIEYHEAMREQADRLADTVREVTRRLGIAEFVEVTYHSLEANPLARYMGRWRATTKSEIVEVVIEPGQVAEVAKMVATDSGLTERRIAAAWSGSNRQITITDRRVRYPGYINAEGNLILGIANEPVTFEKVE